MNGTCITYPFPFSFLLASQDAELAGFQALSGETLSHSEELWCTPMHRTVIYIILILRKILGVLKNLCTNFYPCVSNG